MSSFCVCVHVCDPAYALLLFPIFLYIPIADQLFHTDTRSNASPTTLDYGWLRNIPIGDTTGGERKENLYSHSNILPFPPPGSPSNGKASGSFELTTTTSGGTVRMFIFRKTFHTSCPKRQTPRRQMHQTQQPWGRGGRGQSVVKVNVPTLDRRESVGERTHACTQSESTSTDLFLLCVPVLIRAESDRFILSLSPRSSTNQHEHTYVRCAPAGGGRAGRAIDRFSRLEKGGKFNFELAVMQRACGKMRRRSDDDPGCGWRRGCGAVFA